MKLILVTSLHQKTALHVAAGEGHDDLVKYLVGKEPNIIESQDNDGVSIIDALFAFV